MNKNTIGTYLILGSLVFILGFFLGRYSKNNTELKGDGERVLLARIDSLKNEQYKSDTVILRIKETKIKNHETYITDTIYINSISFDSLKVLFSREYPKN